MTSSLLLADMIRIRGATGRPLDDAGVSRITRRMLMMTPTELTEERNIVRSLLLRLGLTTKKATNRDAP